MNFRINVNKIRSKCRFYSHSRCQPQCGNILYNYILTKGVDINDSTEEENTVTNTDEEAVSRLVALGVVVMELIRDTMIVEDRETRLGMTVVEGCGTMTSVAVTRLLIDKLLEGIDDVIGKDGCRVLVVAGEGDGEVAAGEIHVHKCTH